MAVHRHFYISICNCFAISTLATQHTTFILINFGYVCSYVVEPKEPVDEVISETERKTDLVVQGSYQVCHNCGVISQPQVNQVMLMMITIVMIIVTMIMIDYDGGDGGDYD